MKQFIYIWLFIFFLGTGNSVKAQIPPTSLIDNLDMKWTDFLQFPKIDSLLAQGYVEGVLGDKVKYVFDYNTSGKLREIKEYTLTNTDWVLKNTCTYLYNNGSLSGLVTNYPDYQTYEYTFNAKGLLTTVNKVHAFTYDLLEQYVYSYDFAGNRTLELNYKYTPDSTILAVKEHTYDSLRRIIHTKEVFDFKPEWNKFTFDTTLADVNYSHAYMKGGIEPTATIQIETISRKNEVGSEKVTYHLDKNGNQLAVYTEVDDGTLIYEKNYDNNRAIRSSSFMLLKHDNTIDTLFIRGTELYYRKAALATNIRIQENQRIKVDYNYGLDTNSNYGDIILLENKNTNNLSVSLEIDSVYIDRDSLKTLIIVLNRPIKYGDEFTLYSTQNILLSDGRSLPFILESKPKFATELPAEQLVTQTKIWQTNESIFVQSQTKITQVELYTIYGTLIQSSNFNSNTATLKSTSLAAGMYIVVVQDENNQVQSFKILK